LDHIIEAHGYKKNQNYVKAISDELKEHRISRGYEAEVFRVAT
jgi:hypothetical protein